jgi:hypothetical protein
MFRSIDILFYLSVLTLLSDFGKSFFDLKKKDQHVYFIIGALGDVNDHLEKGKILLAAGQLADALSHFHSAIGRIKLCLIDFDEDVFS